jgi:uncharacterized protein DUF6535
MLSASLSENSTIPAQLVNAFWLAGIYVDILGAVLAIISARWLELLITKETQKLTRNQQRSAERTTPKPRCSLLDTIIAFALFSGVAVVGGGVGLFLIGLVIYVWTRQPLLVAIISTIPLAVLFPLVVITLFPLVAMCIFPQSGRKKAILELLARIRA